MDAVYSDAPDPVSYASEIEGVRHICGHDIHTTIGVGLAKALVEIEDELPGRVMLIFQPAEETVSGARDMIADGLFAGEEPDVIFGLHTFPYDVGDMGTMAGGLMAWSMGFSVDVTDEVDAATSAQSVFEAVKSLNTVPEGEELTLAPLSFTYLRANLSPDSNDRFASIGGEARQSGFASQEAFAALLQSTIDAILPDTASAELTTFIISEGVDNEASLVEASNAAIAKHAPDIVVSNVQSIYPPFSEDFGSFQRETPGIFYFLGVNNPEAGTIGFPHMPDYVADDASIQVGVDAMLAVILEAMAPDGSE